MSGWRRFSNIIMKGDPKVGRETRRKAFGQPTESCSINYGNCRQYSERIHIG